MEDSIYRLRNQDILTLVIVLLLCLGMVMVQSASMSVTGQTGFRLTELAVKQIEFSVFGLAAFFILRRIDYTRLLPKSDRIVWTLPTWLVVIAIVCCTLVLVPHVGIEKNGARRWLPIGITRFQPSELAKWAAVIYLAWWLTARPVDMSKFKGFILTLIPVGVLCLLVVIQDFGTAALIAVVAIAMLMVGRVKWWHLAVVVPPAMGIAYWFVAHKEYRWRRMTAFLDPYAAPQGEGYHMIQSLLSYATGGLSGTGLGAGIQKLGYLPEDTTDFIFSTICEELGLCGAMFTVALYLAILFVAWQAVKKNRDSFGRLLAFGIGAMIGTQAMINIAVATVSVPTKGLSLPLISAGGSGIVITCAALGILGSILKHDHHKDVAIEKIKPTPPAAPIEPRIVTEKDWATWTTAQ